MGTAKISTAHAKNVIYGHISTPQEFSKGLDNATLLGLTLWRCFQEVRMKGHNGQLTSSQGQVCLAFVADLFALHGGPFVAMVLLWGSVPHVSSATVRRLHPNSTLSIV